MSRLLMSGATHKHALFLHGVQVNNVQGNV